jgi:hypothetical protein
MEGLMSGDTYIIRGHVRDSGSGSPIRNAEVRLLKKKGPVEGATSGPAEMWVECEPPKSKRTNDKGYYEFVVAREEGTHFCVECHAFGIPHKSQEIQKTSEKHIHEVDISFPLQLTIIAPSDPTARGSNPVVGQPFHVGLECAAKHEHVKEYKWSVFPESALVRPPKPNENQVQILLLHPRTLEIRLSIVDPSGAMTDVHSDVQVGPAPINLIAGSIDARVDGRVQAEVGGRVGVRLERTATPETPDQGLWFAIRNRTQAISFEPYRAFIDRVMGEGYDFHTPLGNGVLDPMLREFRSRRHGVQAYELLKVATQVFLLLNCGVKITEEHFRQRDNFTFDWAFKKLDEYLGESRQLPYLKRVIEAAFPWLERDGMRYGSVLGGIHEPCLIELIRDYWFEEGMLMQTMNAVTRRFQNVHAPGQHDPLANLEIDPLRPLGNILWGLSQDLQLLSVRRRTYEYMHEYGLTLYGKATASVRPADTRSKFLEAFHNLLYLCSVFFKEDNDTTVIADGYPLLNALKDVHLILAQGAHNQFRDLPWTVRAETMVQEWILAQPEVREFLQSRMMVPYKEPWMPQVDTMKTLQRWSDVTVTQFRDLGVYGEQIVLSIRYGDWIADINEDHAKNWARFFRSDIQAYLHAYRAATGIDLTNPDTVDATLPAIHLQKRLAIQQQGAR